jgi:predicted dehydrogenase
VAYKGTMMKRRDFLQTGGAAGLALSASKWSAYAQGELDAKPKRVGLIGSGWYGKVDLLRLIQVSPVEVVSLCDVDSKMLKEAGEIVASRQKSGKTPRLYHDYRKMLAEKDLDIVLIATPDHWHALPMIEAVEAGADVYVQKPTGVDVVESQAMLAAARKHGSVVQVGTQRRSTPHLIEAMNEVVKAGKLGNIAHAEICCYYHMRNRSNHPDTTPPEHLDFDMWTGPAPMRPFNQIMHPRGWRAFMEYSNGIVGDMCVHMLDAVRWMLDLGWPTHISSTGGILVQKDAKANTTDTQSASFDFGDITVDWNHRSWGAAPDPEYPWAFFIYGDKGTLKASVNKYEFIPRGKGAKPMSGKALIEFDKYPEDENEKDLETHVASAVRGHMTDFLARVADRGRPVADIEQGHISSASSILANIALDLGRTLEWDPVAGRVIGDPEANRRLARPYRAPWEHPDPKSYS